MKQQILHRTTVAFAVLLAAAVALGFTAFQVFAGHNGADVSVDVNTCEPTTVSATILDPNGTHKVGNMHLVVSANGSTTSDGPIPTDGGTTTIAVGPFNQDTLMQWRVFGGGERAYDQPLWNGFGDADFGSDINDYITASGTGWLLAGPDDPNPFTTWNDVNVLGCSPVVQDDCKDGGWETYGFKNQGQCVRFVETGKDSR